MKILQVKAEHLEREKSEITKDYRGSLQFPAVGNNDLSVNCEFPKIISHSTETLNEIIELKSKFPFHQYYSTLFPPFVLES